jgi:hypothetical protein
MAEYRWEEHLRELARVASGDERADLHVADLPEGLDGYTVPSVEFSGASHPFIAIRRSPSRAGQEGTVLHEAAHWRLGHVINEEQRAAVEADASAATDVVRAPFEVSADEYALATILPDTKVLALLRATTTEIAEFLRESCRRFGGCP